MEQTRNSGTRKNLIYIMRFLPKCADRQRETPYRAHRATRAAGRAEAAAGKLFAEKARARKAWYFKKYQTPKEGGAPPDGYEKITPHIFHRRIAGARPAARPRRGRADGAPPAGGGPRRPRAASRAAHCTPMVADGRHEN